MQSILAFLFWAWSEAIVVVAPAYPPNAVTGGTVIAVMHVTAGSVRSIDILQGDASFVEPVRAALPGWRFQAADSGRFLAVVSFRSPQLYAVGSSATRQLEPASSPSGVAYPRKVVEPAYPINSLGEGGVVLRLDLSDTGSISKVKVVQGRGDLTGPCISAVKQWQFAPARNSAGKSLASEAYAVFVLRRPVLSR
jgi:hypothetical protein